jgi:hypothetical protein
MLNIKKGLLKSDVRRIGLNEEQILCNEALASSKFDEISDEQWVVMCEQAASKARDAADCAPNPAAEIASE